MNAVAQSLTIAAKAEVVPSAGFVLTLDLLRPGTPGVILAINEPGALGERLLEMGLTVGSKISVVRRGRLGNPMQLAVRGYILSIRHAQAHNILIQTM